MKCDLVNLDRMHSMQAPPALYACAQVSGWALL
jgi:hypothetical protein